MIGFAYHERLPHSSITLLLAGYSRALWLHAGRPAAAVLMDFLLPGFIYTLTRVSPTWRIIERPIDLWIGSAQAGPSMSRPVQRTGSITLFPILGGLHHRYARV
jgi:hypothetical protein